MNLHLIIGEDDLLVADAAKKVVGDGVGLEVVDSLNSTNAALQLRDLAAVEASFSTPPMFDPRKVTWWKNVRFLPQSKRGVPSEEVKLALEAFAAKLAGTKADENRQLLITADKLLPTSVFAKTLAGVAETIVFKSSSKPWEAAKAALGRALDEAAAVNLGFAAGAADEFVAKVGADSRSIRSEVAKLRDYLGPDRHTVEIEDVRAVSSPGAGVEPSIWAVTDALGERNAAKAVAAAMKFERDSGFAVMMTNTIEKLFRRLCELKDAVLNGDADRAFAELPPFQAKKYRGWLGKWTLRELRVARYRFFALRERAVTSGDGVEALVTAEMIRACRR